MINKAELMLMLEDKDYLQFLQALTKSNWLSLPANNIAKIVADGNFRNLTRRQYEVYVWYVYSPIKKIRHCRRCDARIPWRDMINSLASDNLCRKCWIPF
jgi:hypothetical protein